MCVREEESQFMCLLTICLGYTSVYTGMMSLSDPFPISAAE